MSALFEAEELEEIQRAAVRVLDAIRKAGKSLRTQREVLMLKIGMRASHIEEAVAVGDTQRAAAHLQAMKGLLAEL